MQGTLGSILPMVARGVLAWIEPEVTTVDTVEAGLDTVLPGVVPGAVFREASLAVRAMQGMDVGTKPGPSVVLENHSAGFRLIDEETAVVNAQVPARGRGHS